MTKGGQRPRTPNGGERVWETGSQMKPWWGRETGVKGGVTPLGLLFWADQTKLAGSRLVERSVPYLSIGWGDGVRAGKLFH